MSFTTEVDLDFEGLHILDIASQYIAAGRPMNPLLFFYQHEKPMMCINIPFTADVKAQERSIAQALFGIPVVRPTTCILVTQRDIHLMSGDTVPAVSMCAFSWKGAVGEFFPYFVKDGEAVFIEDAEVDPTETPYSDSVGHMLPTFYHVRNYPFALTDLLRYLEANGHDTEFFGEFNPTTMGFGLVHEHDVKPLEDEEVGAEA